jgi:rhodanese-related sulfurtransferase
MLVKTVSAMLLLTAALASADEVQVGESEYPVGLTGDRPFLYVMHEGRSIKVQRVQDENYELKGYFAKTARKCPPFCINPIQVDPRVATVGEYELFDFMENELRDGTGVLVDARTPAWHRKGTIPGSVNYPFTLLSRKPDDVELDLILQEFGAKPRQEEGGLRGLVEKWGWSASELKTERWDFSDARDLVLWCNGPTRGQSPRAIQGLLAAGYPPSKVRYYRGGMALWQFLGLTTVVPRQ